MRTAKLMTVTLLLNLMFAPCTEAVPLQEQIDSDRAVKVRELTEILLKAEVRQEDPDGLALRILELELLRPQAPVVIKALASLLDFEKPWDRFSPDPKYPAIGALLKIGPAAVPALIEVIKKNDKHSLKFKNAVRTLRAIFREDLSEGVVTLELEGAFAAELEADRLRTAAYELTPKE